MELAAKNRAALNVHAEQEFVGRWRSHGLWNDVPNWFGALPAYVDKILKGTKPADIPIEQPKKFELVIN